MSRDTPQVISPVEGKLARIEEISTQIASESERLDVFWSSVARRLGAVEEEAWSDRLLEIGEEVVFEEESGGADCSPCGVRGLQLGFTRMGEKPGWSFAVRPAYLRQGATLYVQFEHPDPKGEARPLEREPQPVRLAALHQLPELLDAVLGSLNDTLAVVRSALGEPVEAHAMVTSPFASMGNGHSNSSVAFDEESD